MAAAALPTEPDVARGTALTLEQVAAAFPQLEVLEMIGRGGMGSVFKVRQPKLDRFAALKLLPESLAADPAFAGRFEREARLLAKLSHPNIVAVYDYGLAENFFYLLMEFVDGVNLRQAMNASRFEPGQALGIVPKICEALQYAHDEGVLHRDIKPENILLDTKGRVKLVDFGIAKLAAELESIHAGAPIDPAFTQAGVTLGTPSYMAPEQREDPSEVDHRADIYSLGVVFYELLTGELPTTGLARPSEKSNADPRVDAIVQQALERQRDRRQHSAGEMRTQVETLEGSEQRPQAIIAPRFSRRAILGAIWAALFFPFIFAMFAPHIQTLPHTGPTRLEWFLRFTLLPLGIAAPFGTTILGWVAVSQIRHSRGKLRGLRLAVFDGLFFPLLALDAVVATLIELGTREIAQFYALGIDSVVSLACGLGGIVVPLAIDGWLIGVVWRAVKRPLEGSDPVQSLLPARPPHRSKLALVASCFWGLSGVAAIVAWARMPNPPQAIVWAILIAAIMGVVLAIPTRTTRLGKRTLIGSGINIAIWLVTAALSQFIVPSATVMPASTDFHCLVFEADAALVHNLIPASQRNADSYAESVQRDEQGNGTRYAGSFAVTKQVSLTQAQVAQISRSTLNKLLLGVDPTPGVLVDATRSVSTDWWHPGVADSWSSSKPGRDRSVTCGATAFLGFRRNNGDDEVHIDCRVNADENAMNGGATDLASILFYEGKIPRDGALAFLVPFFRDDNSPHYLVVIYEAGAEIKATTHSSN